MRPDDREFTVKIDYSNDIRYGAEYIVWVNPRTPTTRPEPGTGRAASALVSATGGTRPNTKGPLVLTDDQRAHAIEAIVSGLDCRDEFTSAQEDARDPQKETT